MEIRLLIDLSMLPTSRHLLSGIHPSSSRAQNVHCTARIKVYSLDLAVFSGPTPTPKRATPPLQRTPICLSARVQVEWSFLRSREHIQPANHGEWLGLRSSYAGRHSSGASFAPPYPGWIVVLMAHGKVCFVPLLFINPMRYPSIMALDGEFSVIHSPVPHS